MAKSEEKAFVASSGRLFEVSRQVIAQLGYTVRTIDLQSKTISFNTGRSMKSWAGQDMQLTVLERGSSSVVVIGGSLARRGGLASGQQIAWGEKSALTKKILERIGELLPSIPEPIAPAAAPSAPQSAPASGDRLEALARLGQLKESGVLTDEEFQTEKQKLLDA